MWNRYLSWFIQCGCPPVISWFIHPMNTIVISIINHNYLVWGVNKTHISLEIITIHLGNPILNQAGFLKGRQGFKHCLPGLVN